MPAAADPDLALRLAKATADLYGEATARLLELVARRLADGIDEPGWAERKLAQTARLRDDAIAEVVRLDVAAPAAVGDALVEAHAAGAAAAVDELADVDVATEFAGSNRRAVASLVDETVTAVTSTHGRILRSTLDAYRDVIGEAAGHVVTGTSSRRQAAQAALDRFAAKGITGFVDTAGRGWELESYAEMAVRTAAGRAHTAGSFDRYQAAGRDLVIVSDAPQECGICRPWEGKVLSISGADPRRPSVGAATAAGLLHANCRHSLGLYVPGLTEHPTSTEDPAGDEARQQQRYLERGVRRWRRAEAVALDDGARRRAALKRKEWTGRLDDHVARHDLKRLRSRERLGAR